MEKLWRNYGEIMQGSENWVCYLPEVFTWTLETVIDHMKIRCMEI
jgi:hypothetical protein